MTRRRCAQRPVAAGSRSDRRLYLRLLGENSRKYGLSLLGYCLLANHVHLIVIPAKEDSLAKGLGRTHNDYARWLQVRQQRTGHLWQNRFFSCVMDEAHLWAALRCVELNPVRAGLVERAWGLALVQRAGAPCGRRQDWYAEYGPVVGVLSAGDVG